MESAIEKLTDEAATVRALLRAAEKIDSERDGEDRAYLFYAAQETLDKLISDLTEYATIAAAQK